MEFECFPTVVMLFLISVPTNGMIVEIWLKKKKRAEKFSSLCLSKTYFFVLVPCFETAYSVPKRLELTTQFILKLLSISVDQCSLFLSLLEVHVSRERIFNSATIVSRKGGFPCLTSGDERNNKCLFSPPPHSAVARKEWTSLWFLPSQVGERIWFWTRREFYRLGYPSIFFNISKENLEFSTWLCKTLS